MDTMTRAPAKTPIDIPEFERLEPIHTKGFQRVFALLRVALGWTFLWAFLDKAFALGFSTGRVLNDAGATVKIDFFGDAAWIHGASPTAGVLGFATKGPFVHFYQTITGYQMTAAGPTSAPWVDWVYMLSMLADRHRVDPGDRRPARRDRRHRLDGDLLHGDGDLARAQHFVDEHIIDALVLAALFLANAGRYYGLGKVWQRSEFVKKHPILA